MFITRHTLRSQNELASRFEFDDSILDVSDSDFRSLQILENSYRLVQCLAHRLDAANDLSMIFLRAVRKIHAGYVHPGRHQLCDHFFGIGSGADRADDFGPAESHFWTFA